VSFAPHIHETQRKKEEKKEKKKKKRRKKKSEEDKLPAAAWIIRHGYRVISGTWGRLGKSALLFFPFFSLFFNFHEIFLLFYYPFYISDLTLSDSKKKTTPADHKMAGISYAHVGSRITSPAMVTLVALLVLLVAIPGTSGSNCVTFNSTLCNDVIATYPGGMIYSSTPAFLPLEELTLESLVANFSIVGPIIIPDCYQIAKRFVCASIYPPCVNDGKTRPCHPPLSTPFTPETSCPLPWLCYY